MRIALYSPRASHLEAALKNGGDPIFLDDLITALRVRGHQVRIPSRLNVRDIWKGRVPKRRLVAEARLIRRESRQFQDEAWLVYDPSPTYPDLFGWWQRPSRYVLLSAHGWQSKQLPRAWRWLFAQAYRRSLARADAVIATRPASAAGLHRRGVPTRRVWVLPPAVPLWDPMPERIEARRRLGLDEDAVILLCISRFTGQREAKERKTEIVVDLVRVVRGLAADVVLVLVGEGPGRTVVEEEVRRLDAPNRFRLVGAQPYAELKWFFAACDVYAYPDQLDRPRLTVLEAQACGRPVVVMKTPSAALTVDDGRTGLLASDLEEFRRALDALASDRPRCEAMGLAAREYVASFHSIEVRARQIEALLDGHDVVPEVRELSPVGASP
jgi:glycosyltransferase involved in cell wall biosynthesis